MMRSIARTVCLSLPLFCLLGTAVPTMAGKPPRPVTHRVPEAYPTIQAAIDATDPARGDSVLVSDGTYYENIDFKGKAITVASVHGPAATVIDARNSGSVVSFFSAEGPQSQLQGFTLTNGAGSFYPGNSNNRGGAIHAYGASPTIRNCVLANNRAYQGGAAAFLLASTPTLVDCVFSGNTASNHGGAILLTTEVQITVTNCTFTGNAAQYGGAISSSFSSLNITGSTFSANTATPNSYNNGGNGGAIHFSNSSAALSGCALNGNTGAAGGALSVTSDSTVTLEQCTLTDNRSQYGGAIYNTASLGMQVVNSVLARNQASAQGGAFFLSPYGAAVNGILNSTIAENTAFEGGGIYCANCPNIGVTNSILWGNSPQEVTAAGGTPVVSFSDVLGGYAGTGNIDSPPLFSGDAAHPWSLSAVSPCIDAADQAAAPAADLTGLARPQDGNGDGVAVCDMGAYEFMICRDGDLDGWDSCGGDCNDADPTVNPASDEKGPRRNDGKDNNCNGIIDG